jgi:DNA-binding transcriptional regulator YbjK
MSTAPHGTARQISQRGQAKRALIVEATCELALEQGFGAVSHRAVAERAGVPLAATTYYFRSLNDLLASALERLAALWLTFARDAIDHLPPRLHGPGEVADALIRIAALIPRGSASADPSGSLSLYDRYLQAAQRPHLQPIIAAYNHDIDTLIAEVLARAGLPDDPGTARLILAVLDGAVLRALAEGKGVASATDTLHQLLQHMSE